MKIQINRSRCLATLLLVAATVAAHPHYTKEIQFSWERNRQGGQDVSTTIQHITVPYSEMQASSLDVGKTWHLGFSRMKTSVGLKNGDSDISKGEYAINVRRGKDDTWTLLLIAGEGEKKREIELAGELESGLTPQEHLRLDLHPTGAKASTSVLLEVCFGTYRIRIALDRL